MGGMVMGKCEDGQREFFYDEINCEHFQGWYGGLQFGNVYTCNKLLQRMCKFKEADSRAFFHKFIERFVKKGLANTWEFDIHKIHESMTTILCNSK
jgi:hypothetical protein